jgi:hypothetical protein
MGPWLVGQLRWLGFRHDQNLGGTHRHSLGERPRKSWYLADFQGRAALRFTTIVSDHMGLDHQGKCADPQFSVLGLRVVPEGGSLGQSGLRMTRPIPSTTRDRLACARSWKWWLPEAPSSKHGFRVPSPRADLLTQRLRPIRFGISIPRLLHGFFPGLLPLQRFGFAGDPILFSLFRSRLELVKNLTEFRFDRAPHPVIPLASSGAWFWCSRCLQERQLTTR